MKYKVVKCDPCLSPRISSDKVYYVGPHLDKSGIRTNDTLTEVILKLNRALGGGSSSPTYTHSIFTVDQKVLADTSILLVPGLSDDDTIEVINVEVDNVRVSRLFYTVDKVYGTIDFSLINGVYQDSIISMEILYKIDL